MHVVEAVSEAKLIGHLLVSGREPPSLVKIISAHDVFRNRYGDAAQKSSVAFCSSSRWQCIGTLAAAVR